jgi:hypothetical protein
MHRRGVMCVRPPKTRHIDHNEPTSKILVSVHNMTLF